MRWLDLSLGDLVADLCLDEDLLAAAEPVFRVWESPVEWVVLGRSGRQDRDVFSEECRRSGVGIARRCSGGGAVIVGRGCLNYSLVQRFEDNPAHRDVTESLQWVMGRMRAALGLARLSHEGDCDLALDGRKVSGNAQRRTREAFLHHGTLLYDFDATQADRLLKPPHRQPLYRRGRIHSEFLGNIPLTKEELKRRLAEAWC